MLTVAAPDRIEARSNASFEALMWAMSRPGETRTLPEPGLASIIEALIDLECTVFTDRTEMGAQLAATGARIAESPDMADHVFLDRMDRTGAGLGAINCGSALYPDQGATVVARVAHGGQRLRLTGPGIEGARDVALDLAPQFWAQRERLCAYPAGFDLVLVDGHAVIAIPRSTKVEVL
jgi:alpha-D-ribose 1-methylphosphonate 5-triphosphate synthase subunit PhnH